MQPQEQGRVLAGHGSRVRSLGCADQRDAQRPSPVGRPSALGLLVLLFQSLILSFPVLCQDHPHPLGCRSVPDPK